MILIAKCSRSRELFYIRLTASGQSAWLADRTFTHWSDAPASDAEGRGNSEATGSIQLAADYAGCPYCSAATFFKCRCQRLGCWDGRLNPARCPWCTQDVQISSEIRSVSGRAEQ
jgi:hypothetical protein